MSDVNLFSRCTADYASTLGVFHRDQVMLTASAPVVAAPAYWTALTGDTDMSGRKLHL